MCVQQVINQFVDSLTKAEQGFNSFVRVHNYSEIPSEATEYTRHTASRTRSHLSRSPDAQDHPETPHRMSRREVAELVTENPEDQEGDHQRMLDFLAEHADETDAWWHEQRMAIATSPDAYPVGKAWEPERAGPDASREPKCVSDPAPVIEFRNCVMRYGHPDSPKSVTFRVLQLDSLS